MISQVTSLSANAGATQTTATTRTPQQTLGQSDFLKLLSVQLAQQDPLSPMDNGDFMAQMAQFSALEQFSTLAKQMTAMRGDTQWQAATSLLGRQVSYETTEGLTASAVVTAVEPHADGVRIEVDGKFIPFNAVLRVAPPTVSDPIV